MEQNRGASPAKLSRTPFNPDNQIIYVGTRLIDRVVNTHDWELLRPYLNDANATDEATRKNGTAVLLGIAMRGAAILDNVKAGGTVKFTGARLTSIDDLIYAFKTDQNNFIRLANGIIDTLAKVMAAQPGIKVQDRQQTATKQEEAGVMKVEIVGLPDRVTTTAITRDESGNIASSAQLERDV